MFRLFGRLWQHFVKKLRKKTADLLFRLTQFGEQLAFETSSAYLAERSDYLDFSGFDESKSRVGFVPFPTPACRIIHCVYAKQVRNLGAVPILMKSRREFFESLPPETFSTAHQFTDHDFESFEELSAFLRNLASGNSALERGILDSFVRSCDLSVFEGKFTVTAEFLRSLYEHRLAAEAFVGTLDALVLSESSLIWPRCLMAAAFAKKIPVRLLDTSGRWVEISEMSDENFDEWNLSEVTRAITTERHLQRKVLRYLKKRFAGRSRKDMDSARAYSGATLDPSVAGKKVLFLHAFRDATQLPTRNDAPWRFSLFETFYDWADFTLKEISKQDSEWAIRPHPSSDQYPGDGDLLRILLERHGLTQIPVLSNVSTLSLVENRVPIYTNSGTVAIEAAVFGYKAIACSSVLPDELCHVARSKEEYRRLLHLPANYLEPALGQTLRLAAGLRLYRRQNPSSAGIVPRPSQLDRSSRLNWATSHLQQVLSVALQYPLPRIRKQIRSNVVELSTFL